MKIIILTATYNNGNLLYDLYSSLKLQDDEDFSWIIIDDGSIDDTEVIIRRFIDENVVRIKYIKKQNGGKGSAINVGLDYVSKNDFVLIVDADERLFHDAISNAKKYYNKYKQSQIGMIEFMRIDRETNQIICAPKLTEDKISDGYDKISLTYKCDGYIGYFGKAIQNIRFPIFESEKYIGPSVLSMLVLKEFKAVYAYTVLGTTAYQENGITKQGRRLRLKNPYSMIYYCLLLQNKKQIITRKFKYSIAGYAYASYGEISEEYLRNHKMNMNIFISLAKPFGIILAKYWKFKYKNISNQ